MGHEFYSKDEHWFHLDAPRYWYQENSFTEYKLPGEERRKRRGTAQEPGNLLDRYSNHITMQIRLDPGVTQALFFFVISEDGREYSILGVGCITKELLAQTLHSSCLISPV